MDQLKIQTQHDSSIRRPLKFLKLNGFIERKLYLLDGSIVFQSQKIGRQFFIKLRKKRQKWNISMVFWYSQSQASWFILAISSVLNSERWIQSIPTHLKQAFNQWYFSILFWQPKLFSLLLDFGECTICLIQITLNSMINQSTLSLKTSCLIFFEIGSPPLLLC